MRYPRFTVHAMHPSLRRIVGRMYNNVVPSDIYTLYNTNTQILNTDPNILNTDNVF